MRQLRAAGRPHRAGASAAGSAGSAASPAAPRPRRPPRRVPAIRRERSPPRSRRRRSRRRPARPPPACRRRPAGSRGPRARVVSRVARTEASATVPTRAPAASVRRTRAVDEEAQERVEPVVVGVVDVIGLGGGEQHPVGARREQARQQGVAAGAEGHQHLVERLLQFGERDRARHRSRRARRRARSAGRCAGNDRGRTAAPHGSCRPRSAAPSGPRSVPGAIAAPAAGRGARRSAPASRRDRPASGSGPAASWRPPPAPARSAAR